MILLHSRQENVGTLIEYNDNLVDTLMSVVDLGMYSILLKSVNSRTCIRKRIETDEIESCLNVMSKFPINIISMIPPMFNIVGSSKFLAWNGNQQQDEKTEHIVKEIEYELNTFSKIGGSVSVELGIHKGNTDRVWDTIVTSISKIKFRLGHHLILTNSIDAFHTIGKDLSTLHKVYLMLPKRIRQYVSIGIHLTYLFVNGVYDFTNSKEMVRFFDDIDGLFHNKGIVSFIIVSDCMNVYGSKEYEYRRIGEGLLWIENEDTLCILLEECSKRNICVMTECVDDMDVLRTFNE